MMTIIRPFLLLVLILTLGGCAHNKFRSYHGPEVTRIVVQKQERRMYLYHNDRVLAKHDVDLGFDPRGHKNFEGDGKTPEGRYFIDRRNPDSKFHLSLGISYPNAADIAAAREVDKSPGGEIFIHGNVNPLKHKRGSDWTAGCISVSNKEIEKIYAMVRDGTVIDIYP